MAHMVHVHRTRAVKMADISSTNMAFLICFQQVRQSQMASYRIGHN